MPANRPVHTSLRDAWAFRLLGRALEGARGADPGQIGYWTAICRELVALYEKLLDGYDPVDHEALAWGSPASVDLVVLERERERLQGLLEFWYPRLGEFRELELDPDARTAAHHGRVVRLTRREFQLLSYLLSNGHRPCTPEELMCRAWHNSGLSADEVRIYVGRLRRRLSELDFGGQLLNHPGRGYTLTVGPAVEAPAQQAQVLLRSP